jgi:acyl carrier protein
VNTTDAHDLLARLLARIAPEVDLSSADDDEPIQEAFDLDSMDFLNLMSAVHEETGIDVPERDYPSVSTVGGFVAYMAATPAEP